MTVLSRSLTMRGLGLRLMLAAMLLPLGSQAADFAGKVTVSLLAPGGVQGGDPTVALTSTVTIGPDVEISAGNGTNVGDFMLAGASPIPTSHPAYADLGEFIDVVGRDVYVRVLQGASDGSTGYLGAGGQHARYEFSGLNIPGEAITSLSYTAGDDFTSAGPAGLSNLGTLPSTFIHLTSANGFVIELDDLRFFDRGNGSANNHADFKVSFQTTPVPEPSTWAMGLAGIGLAGVCLRRRRASMAA